jgi:hypothetical protein
MQWYWWIAIALALIVLACMLYFSQTTPALLDAPPADGTATYITAGSGTPLMDFSTNSAYRTTGVVGGAPERPPASSVAEAQQRAADDILYRMAYGKLGMMGTYGDWR